MGQAVLTHAEAEPLLVVASQRWSGARVLSIKGPAATALGLRPPRPSLDVDVLVDPADWSGYCDLLETSGWTVVEADDKPDQRHEHSRTFRHALWPLELDVHHHFPGFLADHQDVFETLWSRRGSLTLAHHEVAVPDPVAHAALIALNLLRRPSQARNAVELDHLVDHVAGTFDADRLADLAALAEATGARATLEPVLRRWGISTPAVGAVEGERLGEWRLETAAAENRSVWWLSELVEVGWRERPRLLGRALWPTSAAMRRKHPGRGRLGLVGARVVRLAGGVRALPRAVRIVRRHQRAR